MARQSDHTKAVLMMFGEASRLRQRANIGDVAPFMQEEVTPAVFRVRFQGKLPNEKLAEMQSLGVMNVMKLLAKE